MGFSNMPLPTGPPYISTNAGFGYLVANTFCHMLILAQMANLGVNSIV